jgi:hypothetical protein
VNTKAIQRRVDDGFTKTADDLQSVKDSLQEAIGENEVEKQMDHIREKRVKAIVMIFGSISTPWFQGRAIGPTPSRN